MAFQSIWYFSDIPEKIVETIEEVGDSDTMIVIIHTSEGDTFSGYHFSIQSQVDSTEYSLMVNEKSEPYAYHYREKSKQDDFIEIIGLSYGDEFIDYEVQKPDCSKLTIKLNLTGFMLSSNRLFKKQFQVLDNEIRFILNGNALEPGFKPKKSTP